MIKIVNTYLLNKTKPEKFRKNYIPMTFINKQPKKLALVNFPKR